MWAKPRANRQQLHLNTGWRARARLGQTCGKKRPRKAIGSSNSYVYPGNLMHAANAVGIPPLQAPRNPTSDSHFDTKAQFDMMRGVFCQVCQVLHVGRLQVRSVNAREKQLGWRRWATHVPMCTAFFAMSSSKYATVAHARTDVIANRATTRLHEPHSSHVLSAHGVALAHPYHTCDGSGGVAWRWFAP